MKYGFIQSNLDGTEQKLQLDKNIKIPEEYSYMKNLPKVLDQGREPICVPCSISSYINQRINIRNGTSQDNEVDVKTLFDKYGTDEGMSFKDALHYLRHEGIKTNKGNFKANKYAMVGSIPVLKQAIVMNGPCIGGLPVKDSSKDDFWNGYGFEGGHAISIIGYDKDGFIIRNSWGTSYGHNGYSHLRYEDFNKFYEIWTLVD